MVAEASVVVQSDEGLKSSGLSGTLAHLTTSAPDDLKGERKRSFPAERLVSVRLVKGPVPPPEQTAAEPTLHHDMVAQVVEFLDQAGAGGANEMDVIMALRRGAATPAPSSAGGPVTESDEYSAALTALWHAVVQMDVVCVGQSSSRFYSADCAPAADLADFGVSVVPSDGQEHFVRAPRPFFRRAWTAPWGECNDTCLTELRRLVLDHITRSPGISQAKLCALCLGALTPGDLYLLLIHEWHSGNITAEILAEAPRGLFASGSTTPAPLAVYFFPVSGRTLHFL
jgi:hypothetical protein